MNIQLSRFLSLVFVIIFLFTSLIFAQTETVTSVENNTENAVQPAAPWNMSKSLFGIYLFGSIGYPWGDLLDAEHDSTRLTVTYSDGHTETGKPDHNLFYYGLNGDVYLYTGDTIQTGVRAKFLKGIIQQEISVGGGKYEDKQYYGNLMEFNALMAGGILLWSPFTHRNVAFTSSLTAGKLFYSKIKPMPILQEKNSSQYPLPKKSYDVEGYVLNASIGAQYAFSTVILGMNIAYTQFYISVDGNPYASLGFNKASNKTNIYAVSLELFAGVHF